MKNQKLKSIYTLKALCFIIFTFTLLSCFSLMSFAQIKYKAYLPAKTSENGYASVPFKIKNKTESFSYNKAVKIPSSYDLRDEGLITDIKDQGLYGTCWAFSTIAASESSLLKEFPEKYNSQTLDLSEAHLSYFTYNKAADPLNLTGGDYTKSNYSSYLDNGGNFYMATFNLAKWFGVANETVMPYEDITPKSKYSSSLAYKNNEAVLENALWVSTEDPKTIKELMLKYGACGASIYYDEFYLSKKNAYYRSRSDANTTNHSITIVGWDDNYPKENFKTSLLGLGLAAPKKNGAWLIKNSYGKDYNDGGYFWLSYEEKSLLGDCAVFFDFMPTGTYDYNYQYDGSTVLGMYYDYGKIYMANVFTARSPESLKAFSFCAVDSDETFKYQIYTDVKGTSNPTNGTPVFKSYQNCTPSYTGYHTIELPKSVSLKKGTKFSVVIISTNKKGNANAAADYSGAADLIGSVYSYAYSKKGQSFYGDGKNWYQPESGENIRIKAFTTKRIVKLKSVTAPKDLSLIKGNEQTVTLVPLPDEADAKAQWSSDNEKVATVTSSGKIKAVSYGTTYINYVCNSNSNIKGRIKVTVCTAKVTGLKLKNVQNTQFTISWNKVKDADGYQINEKQKNGTYKAILYTNKTTFKKSSLKNGQRYTYKIRAYKLVGGKKIYAAGSAITAFTKPAKAALTKSKVTKTSVALKWKKVTNADMYRIYMYNPQTKSYESKGTVKGTTSLTVKKLKANTEYKFKIRCITLSGETKYFSDYSKELKVKTSK